MIIEGKIKYLNYKIVILVLMLGLNTSVRSQTAIEDFNTLLKKATQEEIKNNYASALKYYTKAELLAKENKWVGKECVVKNAIGNLYGNLSNYGEALNYYIQSWEIAKKFPHSLNNEATILSNVARLYSRNENTEKALNYYNKAYKLAQKDNSVYSQVLVAVNMADLFNNSGQYHKAEFYLEEVKQLLKPGRLQQVWEINYAENLFLRGKEKEAQEILEKLLPTDSQRKHPDCYTCVLELLARVYEKQGKLTMAIGYAKKGLHNTYELDGRIKLYNQLAHLYNKEKKYSIALNYKDSVIQTKDSLAIRVNNQLFETNKVKLDIQEYQNDLKINQQKRSSERMIFVIVGFFTLVIFFVTYKALRNRMIKQRQEKELTENMQKIIKLELKEVKNDVAEKNRELSTKALYLSGRNKLIEEVINALSKLTDVSSSKEINQYVKNLKGYLKTDTEWEEFITHFEQVNPEFIKTLKQRHPKLTANDIRFLCYIYMNLDVKEISTIFSITAEATQKRKQRIAKKMELEVENLRDYILSLIN